MPSIREAAEKLSKREKSTDNLSEKFEGIDSVEKDSTVKESFLSKEVEKKEPGKVAGVDGGIVKKRYSSGDIVGVRAVAAIFDFNNFSLDEASYIPGKSPEPEFHYFPPDNSKSLDKNAEAERLDAETDRVIEAMEEADTVFLDGSVVPSYLEDEEVIDKYNKVFGKAESGEVVGVVEDSFGMKMTRIIEDKLDIELGNIRDSLLMDSILEEGERSFVRRYSDSPVEHPVLQELEDKCVNRLHTFYLKLSEKDIPLRIDYFGDPENADSIAGKLMALKSSESYTVPSPVVEADKRAKVPEKYIQRLEKRFSPEVRRRDRRGF